MRVTYEEFYKAFDPRKMKIKATGRHPYLTTFTDPATKTVVGKVIHDAQEVIYILPDKNPD